MNVEATREKLKSSKMEEKGGGKKSSGRAAQRGKKVRKRQ